MRQTISPRIFSSSHPASSAVFAAGISTFFLLCLTLPPSALAVEYSCAESAGGDGLCGRASCGDDDITAGDALTALRTAVGTASCSLCRCDTDASGAVLATDAVRILLASVSQPVALTCPRCNSLTIEVAEEATDLGSPVGDLVRTKDGGLLASWTEEAEVLSRRYDAWLLPIDEASVVATSQESLGSVRACEQADGGADFVWQAASSETFSAPHDYADGSNVKAARTDAGGASTGSFDAHAVVNGSQTALGVFCDGSGTTSAVWLSRCSGLRSINEGAYTSFTPPNCPLNGIWLRRFDFGGEPLGDPQVVLRTYAQDYLPWEPAIGLPDGRIGFASTNRLVIADAGGLVQLDTKLPSPSHIRVRHDCSAGADRCVGVHDAYSLVALVYDVDSIGAMAGITVRPTETSYEPPLDITIRASSPVFACDRDGICLAAWNLLREEENFDTHYEDSMPLGIFARAFNAHTGELGPEIEMDTTNIVNIGPARFAIREGSGILRVLTVH